MLSVALLSKGFMTSKNDYSLFTRFVYGSLIVIVMYVDDIILVGDNLNELNYLKSFLDAQLRIKDFSNVHYFQGLEIAFTPTDYTISQHKYTSKLFQEFKCDSFTSFSIPLDYSMMLLVDMGAFSIDASLYRHLITKLNFLQHTRPDISFSAQLLSQFLNAS